MKKTKIVKPILASIIIESLLASSVYASGSGMCKLNEDKQQLLNQLTQLNFDTTYSLHAMGMRLKNVTELKDKAIAKIITLKKVDEKQKNLNSINAFSPKAESEIDTNAFGPPSTESNTQKIALNDKKLNIEITIEVPPSGAMSRETALKQMADSYAQTLETFDYALKTPDQKIYLSEYLTKNNFNKLNYILKNSNDYSEFGICLSDIEFQKNRKCDNFIPTTVATNSAAREQYFSELSQESTDYIESFKNIEINKSQRSVSKHNNAPNLIKEVTIENSPKSLNNKSLNVFDAYAIQVEDEANENKNKENFKKGLIDKLKSNFIPTTTNKQINNKNINEIANYIINENITNEKKDVISVNMPTNATPEMQKAYHYHKSLGALSNLELLFMKPIENIYNEKEELNDFSDRLSDTITQTRKDASDYDMNCLEALKYNPNGSKTIPADKITECSILSEKFVTNLDDYEKNISSGVKALQSDMDKKLDDKFYAVENLKLIVLKEAYDNCKKSPGFSPDIEVFPCSQINANQSLAFSNINNFGESTILMAKAISKDDLNKNSKDFEIKKKSCALLLNEREYQKEKNESLIQNYCESFNEKVNRNNEERVVRNRKIEEQMKQTERNYHLSVSTTGPNKIIYTPKQSFAEGFVRALVNNLATAAPGYMNYFQQGVAIEAMRSDGFLKKQALHNHKFYQTNVLSGQLPWYNSLSSFGYTVNSSISYPLNSTTNSTSLSGSGIGTGFSF